MLKKLTLLTLALAIAIAPTSGFAQDGMDAAAMNDYMNVVNVVNSQPQESDFDSSSAYIEANDAWTRDVVAATREFVVAHPESEAAGPVFYAHIQLLSSDTFTEDETAAMTEELRELLKGTSAEIHFTLMELNTDEDLDGAEHYAKLKSLYEESDGNMAVAQQLQMLVLYSGKLDAETQKMAMGEMMQMEGIDDNTKASIAGTLARLEKVGQPFEFSFTAIDGEEVSSDSLRGQVVLIDFWATWCGPCVQEMPRLMETYDEYHDQGFEIVGVSLDAGIEELQQFVDERDVKWHQWFDGAGGAQSEFANAWGIEAIPTMFLIDREGKLRSIEARAQLEELLPELLAEPAPADEAAMAEAAEAGAEG